MFLELGGCAHQQRLSGYAEHLAAHSRQLCNTHVSGGMQSAENTSNNLWRFRSVLTKHFKQNVLFVTSR